MPNNTTEIKEIKNTVLTRTPPGDRWVQVGTTSPIFESLTDALEHHYQKTGNTDFYLSARKGTVEVVLTEEVVVEKPIKRFSLYGED